MLILLRRKNYLKMIENSVFSPTHLFKNIYASIEGEERDIVENGGLSCAFFMSGILYMNKLCSDMHAGVDGLEKDLINFGWFKISEPKIGAIIFWEYAPWKNESGGSRHAGFAISQTEAISNASKGTAIPYKHPITLGMKPDGQPERKIDKIYWHKFLDQDKW